MDAQLALEQKHVILKNELCENLDKKRELESKINEQFEALKRLEISLEKHSLMAPRETK
jgi:hypothetical protein